ncbi:hypothetical protein [Ekhidna sp.]
MRFAGYPEVDSDAQAMRNIIFVIWVIGFNCQAQRIDNILDLELYLPNEAETWYNKNYNKEIKSDIWILGSIFNAPSNASKKVGDLITYYDPAFGNFILQFRTVDGSVLKEIRNVGDWGYGVHLNVIGSTDGFIRFPDEFLNSVAWIKVGNGLNSINGYVSTFLDQIVSLPTISVKTYPDGVEQLIKRGNYVIEKRQGNSFIIRSEIPSDMPCGSDIKKVEMNSLPRYQLMIKNLIKEDSEFSIELAYPRGC